MPWLSHAPMASRVCRNLAFSRRPTLLIFWAFFAASCVNVPGSICLGQADPQVPPTPLSVDTIFQDHFFASKGSRATWQNQGHHYEILAPDDQGNDTITQFSVDGSSEPQVVLQGNDIIPQGETQPLKIDSYQYSPDRSKLLIFTRSQRVWRLRTRGDYWVLDLRSKALVRLGAEFPDSTLMFAKFAPDGQSVAYVQNRDLYWESLVDGTVRRLTTAESETVCNGTFDWVYEEEFALRDGFQFNASGDRIAFWQIDSSAVGLFPLLNNTQQLYPAPQWIAYPKVGTTNPSARIGVVNLATQEQKWLAIPGDSRENYIHAMEWISDTNRLVVKQLNRLQNTCHHYVLEIDQQEVYPVFTETTDTWIEPDTSFHWCELGKSLFYLCEMEGWNRLCVLDLTTGQSKRIPTGDFDVIQLSHFDESTHSVYFIASPHNATQRYLYRCNLQDNSTSQVTPVSELGTHNYQFSVDGQFAIHVFSAANQPPVTQIIRLADHKIVRVLEENLQLREKVAASQLPPFDFVKIKANDSLEMDAWMITPPQFDHNKKYPLIVHVYGEPAGTTVNDSWGGDRGLWHRYMASLGYVVVSIDNRGTPAPKGTQWRKCVYRQIGTLASQDQAAALQQLLKQFPFIDAERVGIWGWSGGGSMTLNALFRYPELYHAGVSIAPVPNQLYYDTIYQERYMGLPADNAEGYQQGSPITHAKNLQGELLLVHGTGDDNCHYQTMELLINELIRLNKRFTMFAYPNRSHAISEGENTTRHLYQMITNHFLTNVVPGAR